MIKPFSSNPFRQCHHFQPISTIFQVGFGADAFAASENLRTEIAMLVSCALGALVCKCDSLAFVDFPAIFESFKQQKFTLLRRGSRDCFQAKKVHRLCEGGFKKKRIVLNINGKIFSGFTLVVIPNVVQLLVRFWLQLIVTKALTVLRRALATFPRRHAKLSGVIFSVDWQLN
jgi:hypothetical protein